MIPRTKQIRSRDLSDLSYLIFQYPTVSTTGTKRSRVKIPMLENIDISETQKPSLSTYDLIGRSGNLFSYAGSKSRDLTLNFNITLPNVTQYITDEYAPVYDNDPSLSIQRKKLKMEDVINEAFPKAEVDPNIGDIDRIRAKEGITSRLKDEFRSQRLVSYWINTIRTSVINNSQNTSLGPPTIYVNHGDMYQNIPCVCTNFSLKNIPNGGYDLTTLIPRVVGVTLNLSENRTGDLGKFVPFRPVKRNNQPGWESVIEYGTLDPGRYL